MKRTTAAAVALMLVSAPVCAHSGGTDANGCHVDSSTGLRHCHGGGTGAVDNTAGIVTLVIIGGALLAVSAGGLLVWWYSTSSRSTPSPRSVTPGTPKPAQGTPW